MRVRLPSVKAGRLGKPQTKDFFKTLVLAVVMVLIIIGAYAFVHRHNGNKAGVVYKPESIQTQISSVNKSAQQSLAAKDYVSYQAQEAFSSQQLILSKNYNGAEQLLNGVIASIPKEKIASVTYQSFIALARAKGDKQQLEHYEQLIIPLLEKEGDTKSAQAFQQELDTLR